MAFWYNHLLDSWGSYQRGYFSEKTQEITKFKLIY